MPAGGPLAAQPRSSRRERLYVIGARERRSCARAHTPRSPLAKARRHLAAGGRWSPGFYIETGVPKRRLDDSRRRAPCNSASRAFTDDAESVAHERTNPKLACAGAYAHRHTHTHTNTRTRMQHVCGGCLHATTCLYERHRMCLCMLERERARVCVCVIVCVLVSRYLFVVRCTSCLSSCLSVRRWPNLFV